MSEPLDGCPEFDERLLESAFQAYPDAPLDAHLQTCERCRRARDLYLRTGEALASAFARPRPLSRRRRRLSLAGVAIAAGLLALFTATSVLERGEEAGLTRIEQGSAMFDFTDRAATVETPLGPIRGEDAIFTVSVEDGAMSGKSKAGIVVTVAVASGIVWWATPAGEVAVRSGETVVRGAEATPVGEPPGASPVASPSPPTAPIAQEPPAAPTGLIVTGRVIDDVTEEPIAGARVAFGARMAGREGEPSGLSSTDGAFRVEIENADWAESFFVEAEGYAPLVRFFEGRREGHEPGETYLLGDVRLVRGERVLGRVVSPAGEPVGGAAILLANESFEFGLFMPATAREFGRSDAAGTFVLTQVPPTESFPITLFAVVPEGLGWTLLPVVAGRKEISGVEVVLRPTAALLVHVQDAEGRAVPHAVCRAEPHFRPLGGRVFDKPDHSMWFGTRSDVTSLFMATTDAAGNARLDHLPLGEESRTYDVVVWCQGFGGGFKDGVSLDSEEETSVTVTLEAPRVRAVSGVVTTPSGAPLEGASISSSGGNTTTDVHGRYRIEIQDPGFTGDFWIWAEAPGSGMSQRTVAVPAAGDVEGVDFVLEKAQPIEGRVVDQAGEPIAGANLQLWRFSPLTRMNTVTTEADGRFAFSNATAGDWSLIVNSPPPFDEWVFDPRADVRGGDRSVLVVLKHLPPGRARLVADVVDAETGEALDPVEAMVYGVERPKPGEPHRYATPKFEPGRVTADRLRPGRWLVWVRVTNQMAAGTEFDVGDRDTEIRARNEVGHPGSLTGRVVSDEVESLEDLLVYWSYQSSSHPIWYFANQPSPGKTQPDGSFRIADLVPGRYRLSVCMRGVVGEGEAEVPSGGNGQVEIRIHRGGWLLFRGGPPPANAFVEVLIAEGDEPLKLRMSFQSPDGEPLSRGDTVHAGRVRWKVRFREDNYQENERECAEPAEGEDTVAPGESVEINVPIVPKKRK